MLTRKTYNLIAFDIDGTILDINHQVCDRLINVVCHLQNMGYLFTLVSARVPYSVLKIANELGIKNDVICLNGSFITNHAHEVIYSRMFLIDMVRDVLDRLDKNISRNYYYNFDWILEYPSKFSAIEEVFLTDICKPQMYLNKNEVNKITLIGEHEMLVKAQHILIQNKNLLVSFSHTNYLEISCNSISKFNGLKYYAETIGLSPKQVIAFGDGENDVPMLSQVGLGVAMGNAVAHVKTMAKDVAGNHDEQGVALYLEKLLAQNIL